MKPPHLILHLTIFQFLLFSPLMKQFLIPTDQVLNCPYIIMKLYKKT